MFNFNTNNVLAVIAIATIAGPSGITTTALPTEQSQQKQQQQQTQTDIEKTITTQENCGQSMLECTNHHMGSLNSNLRRMLDQKYPTAKDASGLCRSTMMFKDCLINLPDCDEDAQMARIISEVNKASEHCDGLNGMEGVHEHYNGPSNHPHHNNKSIYKYKNKSGNDINKSQSNDNDEEVYEDSSASSISIHRSTLIATGVVVAALQMLF